MQKHNRSSNLVQTRGICAKIIKILKKSMQNQIETTKNILTERLPKITPSYVIIFNDSLLHFVTEFKSQI